MQQCSRCTAQGWHSYVFQFVFALCVVWGPTLLQGKARLARAARRSAGPMVQHVYAEVSSRPGGRGADDARVEIEARSHLPFT